MVIHALWRQLSRVAFTHFLTSNPPMCQNWGAGGSSQFWQCQDFESAYYWEECLNCDKFGTWIEVLFDIVVICLSFPGSCTTKINGAKLEGTAISNGLRSNVEVDACIELCDAETDCHFWSWQGAGANTVCRLFSDRTSQKRVEGAMSGECSLPGWCFRSETNSKFSISFERKLLGNLYPVDLLFNFQSTPMLASACQQHQASHLFRGSCSSVKLASGKAPLQKGKPLFYLFLGPPAWHFATKNCFFFS